MNARKTSPGPWRWWTPTVRTDPYPFKYLAGVGVALKLVLALGGPDREDALFARYCTLAAIGTIADVMRMEGENRTIVSCGLAALTHTDFVGIHALLKEAGLLGKPITSIQIGFVLSPRINAAGRMGAADLAADLLQETRSRQGGGAGQAAMRPEPGAAGGGAVHLRRRHRPDRAAAAGGAERAGAFQRGMASGRGGHRSLPSQRKIRLPPAS